MSNNQPFRYHGLPGGASSENQALSDTSATNHACIVPQLLHRDSSDVSSLQQTYPTATLHSGGQLQKHSQDSERNFQDPICHSPTSYGNLVPSFYDEHINFDDQFAQSGQMPPPGPNSTQHEHNDFGGHGRNLYTSSTFHDPPPPFEYPPPVVAHLNMSQAYYNPKVFPYQGTNIVNQLGVTAEASQPDAYIQPNGLPLQTPPVNKHAQPHTAQMRLFGWDTEDRIAHELSNHQAIQTEHRNDTQAPPISQTVVKPQSEARSATVATIDCTEPRCKRRFRPKNPGTTLCNRHQKKFDRNHAGPPMFKFDPEKCNYNTAFNEVYPHSSPMKIDGDDFAFQDNELHWVNEFTKAANTPYIQGSQYHEFHSRQQKVYNGKVFNDDGYESKDVNVRMRLLYEEVLNLHRGGQAVYPKGGDNDGYGNTTEQLIFSDRLAKIIDTMKLDKRVCLDVIEGRGVTAFVRNPTRYEKRKTQNKDSNTRKQAKQQLGDKIQAMRKAKGKDIEVSDVDSDDSVGDEDDVEDHEAHQTATAIYTPASLNKPLENDDDYAPTPEKAKNGRGKRKRQNRSPSATVPTTRQRKKAKATVDEAVNPTSTSVASEQPLHFAPGTLADIGAALLPQSTMEHIQSDYVFVPQPHGFAPNGDDILDFLHDGSTPLSWDDGWNDQIQPQQDPGC